MCLCVCVSDRQTDRDRDEGGGWRERVGGGGGLRESVYARVRTRACVGAVHVELLACLRPGGSRTWHDSGQFRPLAK